MKWPLLQMLARNFALNATLQLPPEKRCELSGMMLLPPEIPSGRIVTSTLPNLKNWKNAATKRPLDCAAEPKASATRLPRWTSSLAVSVSCIRVHFPTAFLFYLVAHTFFRDAEAWPESEAAAYAAVAKSREETVAAGGTCQLEDNVWTQHEYLIGTEAHIPVIKGIALSFKLGILKIAESLWSPTEIKVGLQRMKHVAGSSAETREPETLDEEDSDKGEAPNATTQQTRILLKAIPHWINVLLNSAGQTGAETTLQTVLSWYPQVKLSQLYSLRENAADLLEKTYTEVNRLASTMMNWFSPYDYTPYLDEGGNPLAATSISGLAEELSDSGSSQTSPRSKQAGAAASEAQSDPT